MEVLYKTKATFADGEVIEDTVTNPNFKTAEEVEELYKREFGDELRSIQVSEVRSRC